MKIKMLMASAVLLPLAVLANPTVKSASATVSGSSNSGRLSISYAIAESGSKNSEIECRYLQIRLFSCKSDAEAWAKEIRDNYGCGYCGEEEVAGWNLYDEDEVDNGSHSFSYDLDDEFGMSARDFRREWPAPYLVVAVFDDCEENYSYKIVAVKFSTISVITEEIAALYGKARTVTGVCYDYDENLFGLVTLKTGKVNTKTGVVKVTVSIAPFVGRKVSASTSFEPEEDGTIEGLIKLSSPLGESWLYISGEFWEDERGREQVELWFECSTEESGYYFYSADVGGSIDASEMLFMVDMCDFPDVGEDWEPVVMAEEEPIYVTGGTKWSFGKVPTLKYVAYRDEGYVWYELDGLWDENKPNACGLKLTYTAKTGVFKGQYYIYLSNECCTEKKPTLKKLKVSVNGVVIDGCGFGTASVKFGSETFNWPVYIEPSEWDEPYCPDCYDSVKY